MNRNMNDIKVFVSSVLPEIGIDMLRKENFNVITWNDDSPIPQDILNQKCKTMQCSYCARLQLKLMRLF